jgi:hypothetical protein
MVVLLCLVERKIMAAVRYLPPFAVVKQKFLLAPAKDRVKVSIDYDGLLDVIRLVLQSINVDEEWYLKQYPDVAEAVKSGVVTSARAHFISNGYFEGRLPFGLEVDDKWYTTVYPDVAEAIQRREVASPLEHFQSFGYAEGRLPGDAS